MTYPSDAGSDRRLIGEGWMDSASVKGRLLFHRDRVIEWLRSQRVGPDDW